LFADIDRGDTLSLLKISAIFTQNVKNGHNMALFPDYGAIG
jgi:hypothetical protein